MMSYKIYKNENVFKENENITWMITITINISSCLSNRIAPCIYLWSHVRLSAESYLKRQLNTYIIRIHSSRSTTLYIGLLVAAETLYSKSVASEAICKWGAECRREAPAEFFYVPPHFSLVPPTWGGTMIVCYRLRYNKVVKSGEGQ